MEYYWEVWAVLAPDCGLLTSAAGQLRGWAIRVSAGRYIAAPDSYITLTMPRTHLRCFLDHIRATVSIEPHGKTIAVVKSISREWISRRLCLRHPPVGSKGEERNLRLHTLSLC